MTTASRGTDHNDGTFEASARRLTDLLTVAVLSTYLLLVFGAVLAVRGTSAGTWPLLVPEATVAGVLSLIHRLTAFVTGGALLVATGLSYRSKQPRLVRLLLVGSLLAFGGQVVIGAFAATGGPAPLVAAHLPLGVITFVVLVGALVFALDTHSQEFVADSTFADGAREEAGWGSDSTATVHDEHRNDRGTKHERTGITPTIRAYVRLTKPRLLWLLCLLAGAGMALAALAGSPPNGVTVVTTLGGGILAVGASGVANHLYERDRDRQMDRTADRPLAQQQVSPRGAAVFCAVLTVGALLVPWLFVSALVAGLIGAAIGYYAVVYTVVLKPNTRWSTLVGGGAGALPAVIGWAAGTGSIGVPGLLLAGIVVCWTPAHFYNLAIAYRDDYARGGFPLVPVIEGPAAARRRIVGYLAVTLLAVGWLGAVTALGVVYALAAILGATVFLFFVVESFRDQSDAAALRAFHASNAFLGLVLLAIVIEGILAVTGGGF